MKKVSHKHNGEGESQKHIGLAFGFRLEGRGPSGSAPKSRKSKEQFRRCKPITTTHSLTLFIRDDVNACLMPKLKKRDSNCNKRFLS